MGRLITLSDIKNPLWYFEDAYWKYGGGSDRWDFDWPNPSFPYHAAIFYKDLENNKIKIEIRKWIELHINDTVIYESIDRSYKVYYGDQKPPFIYGEPYDMWEKSYKIDNRWFIFYFEDEHSATAFRLRFGNLIKEVIDRLPEHLDKITKTER